MRISQLCSKSSDRFSSIENIYPFAGFFGKDIKLGEIEGSRKRERPNASGLIP